MDTLRTCHTVIIILDNLITLIGFVLSCTNLFYPTRIGSFLDRTAKVMQKKIRVIRKNTKRILLPEYSLIFQMTWTREKFGKLLNFLVNDTGEGGTLNLFGENEIELCDHDRNSTLLGILETVEKCSKPEEILDETASPLSNLILCILFVFVGFVCSKIN